MAVSGQDHVPPTLRQGKNLGALWIEAWIGPKVAEKRKFFTPRLD